MLSVEGQVVCEGEQPNIVSGLAALFASFYNFNLQYQKEAACSLEFIQRLDAYAFAIYIQCCSKIYTPLASVNRWIIWEKLFILMWSCAEEVIVKQKC